jgi:hypothetical protein
LEVLGLVPWVTALNGPEFRDIANALRDRSKQISEQLVPAVQAALALSQAPQAPAFAGTVAARRDRVPVVVIGAKNPTFRNSKFSRRGMRRDGEPRADNKRRKGAMAHGIVYGPAGGRRDAANANYYQIPRDDSGGPVGEAIQNGPAFDAACEAWFEAYRQELAAAGIPLTGRI